MSETERTIVPFAFAYKNRAGAFLQRFLDDLREKKITGSKCKKCGYVYLPPRSVCSRCRSAVSDFVNVKDEGTIMNFTVAHVKIETGEIKKLEEREVYALVKLKGADSLFLAKVLARPEDVKVKAKVKAVWNEKTEGSYSDLLGFKIIS